MKGLFLTGFVLLSCPACFLMPGPSTRTEGPPDGLLTETSPAEQERVAAARVEVGRAKDEIAAAKLAHQSSRDAALAARQVRDEAQERVGEATLALTDLQHGGSPQDFTDAGERLRAAESSHWIETARCDLRDREIVLAVRHDAVAKADLDVASARLVCAKVVAVNTLDRPDRTRQDVVPFEAEIRRVEGEAAVARTELDSAKLEVEVCQARLTSRERSR